ncbi:bifunctional glutamate N-acetyltransferase/amino-acid acetyltransferase ArgJ [Rhabdothermincola salaria]|uniref:bifunctional glutamate N-acetyltransferase/amino-acid acetyltransferase ArgJ n=1 Tax=Rhabdothermincola salaria TaxID=2903142 RepID=UPI001E6215E5|nr:bifunctional glutamate N-acetyltransferase/amino-acid acetyltransferase ArgJ [Rhabdothermincola salaria]MCD9623160.1 bifunctional glutamate N-acetyltransferase/amino-acid acetyltransferase ArgJ [Rhabdothermincola salaria]
MSVTAAPGFTAAGTAAGIKESGARDLALVAVADGRPAPAAGVFTRNHMTAAPVLTTKAHLAASGGQAAAVILNSGNANAATGEKGCADAEAMCDLVAAELGVDRHHVLVCSTGLIGIPLPMAVVEAGIAPLVAARSEHGGEAAAAAIMTTDTASKEVVVEAEGFVVGGMAKGAAMLSPNMATMLAVLTTDAAATPAQLQAALTAGVADSFNALDVDGCTSTNDTVLLLSSGRAGEVDQVQLERAVAAACADLAAQMAGDAEGATKVVRLTVTGAHSDDEAQAGARYVARSQLVKCSWYGQDPYWGRIASDLGSCGIAFDQALVSVSYGGIEVCRGGVEVDHDREAVAAHMAQRHLEIAVDLGLGAGRGTILTNDLTHAYIDENMGTS